MTDRSVSVRLQAHVDQYLAAMKKAGAETRAFKSGVDKDLQALGSKYVSLGQKMTLGLSAPLALLAKQAVGYAGAANEALNRNRVVFGEHAAEIEEWADGSAHSMGIAQHEAIGTAATFANMFTQMGIGSDRSRRMSMDITQLAADVGSFRDIDPTEMLVRMRAAIVGEYEPLRNMGIILTDVSVRNEAVRMGLAATREEATASALVQARYSLILQQTSRDQGDYARTADDAVNAQRTATAAYKDAMVELGDNLLPIVAKGALAFADFAEAFGSLPEGAQSLVLGLGGIAAAAGPVIFLTGSLIKNLELIQARGPRAVAALKFGGVALGAAAIVTAFDAINDQLVAMRHGSTSVDEVELALVRMSKTGEIGGEIASRFGENLGDLADAFERVELGDAGTPGNPVVGWLQTLAGTDLGGAQEKVEALDAALASLAMRDPAAAKAAFEELMRLLEEQGVDVELVEAHLTGYTDALAQNETQQLLTGGAAGAAGAAIGDQADEVMTAAEAIEAYSTALDAVYDAAFGAQEITGQMGSDLADLAQRVIDAREAGDQWATSLDSSNTSGLANIATIQGLVRSGLDLATWMAQQGATTGQIESAMSALYNQLVTTLTGLNFNRAEAENLLGVLMSFPGMVDVKINVETEQAEARLTRLLGLIQLTANSIDVLEAEKWVARSGGVQAPSFGTILEGIGALPTLTPSFGSGSTTDPAEEALRRRREEDARMGRLAEFGGITVDEYRAYLDQRLAATERYSEEWAGIWNEIDRVNQDIGEGWREAAEYMETLEDSWWEMLARQHEVGELSTREFLNQLEDRLRGLQQYSDEWMETWREINHLKDDITQSQLDIMAAVEKERLYWVGFNETMEQRFTSGLREVAQAPVVVQGGSSKSSSFSQTNYITAPSTGGAFSTANERMRDAAFLMGS